jgi:hypothetical protein
MKTYTLKLIANNGETVILTYDTRQEAERMREAFMLMGQYREGVVL